MTTRELRSVLLLEPCAWRGDGIARFLSQSGVRVSGASDFSDDERRAEPDAVMVAHALVGRYGRDILDRVRGAYPSIGILVHGETECLSETASILSYGAQGYFALSSPQPQLLEALRVVCSRGIWAPRAAVVMMAQQVSSSPTAAADPSEAEDRTIFALLLEGLSNKEIASRLGVAEVTVKARLTRLYKRHGVRTRLQLLSSAIRQHLIDLAP